MIHEIKVIDYELIMNYQTKFRLTCELLFHGKIVCNVLVNFMSNNTIRVLPNTNTKIKYIQECYQWWGLPEQLKILCLKYDRVSIFA